MTSTSKALGSARRLFQQGDVRGALDALDTRFRSSGADAATASSNWTGEEFLLRGWALLALGDVDAALTAFWEAGTRAAAAGDVASRIEMLNGYAQCFVADDQVSPARGINAEATVRSRKLGRPGLLALTMRTRGIVALDRCLFDEAERSLEEALVHAKAGRDAREEGASGERLAAFLRMTGRAAAAARVADAAVGAGSTSGDRRVRALARWTHGSCLAALGDEASARAARAAAEEDLDALHLPRPRGPAPDGWHRLFLESRGLLIAGHTERAVVRARIGARALLDQPPLLAEHAAPGAVMDLRSAAAEHFARVLDDRTIDVSALRVSDQEALSPVDDAPAAVQQTRRVRVQAQMRMLRADRRALHMGMEVPAGAREAAREAIQSAWREERAARATAVEA